MALKRRGAYAVFLTISAVGAWCGALIVTVNLIYQVTTVGLSPLQLVLVGTMLEVTCFVCQVPTGILADLYSRRSAVIIGWALQGLGFMLEGLVPRFEAVLLAQVIWGIGATFTSGAQEAWISDEIGEDRAAHAFLRGSQVGSIGGLVGIGLSVLLGSISINLPIVVGGAGMVLLAGWLIAAMPEIGFRAKQDARDSHRWRRAIIGFVGTTRDSLRLMRVRSILLIIVAIELFYGLYSEGYDRLATDHLLTNFTFPLAGVLQPVIWFGLMGAGVQLLSPLGVEFIRRRVNTTEPRAIIRALFVINVAQVLGLVGIGLAGNFGAVLVAFSVFNVARSVPGPLWTGWINRQMESSVRATMHSFMGQVNAFGQIVGGPLVGGATQTLTSVIGLGAALRVAMLIVAGILSPVLALYGRAWRQQRAEIPADTEIQTAEPIGV